jgi:hypothetical protein
MSASDRLSTALADRYRIERELGAGGMATVYLAQDLKHDRQVALKVLRPELAAVLGAERFVQEIKTTAALQHPHILPLFDSGSAAAREGGSTEFLYYVMPYIEGETLRDRLNRETQLGVDEAVRIAREVGDALDYAHRHGVIHRDIKPENILLHDGRPMVADFGIALAVSAAAGGRMTETGLSLGTPHYMSPEQATAEKEITGRSDVYSLASVLYEMLAGQPPHLGGSAQQIIMKIIAEDAAPVTTLRKSVPAHVAAAVAKALEKLPADRFAAAAAAVATGKAAPPDTCLSGPGAVRGAGSSPAALPAGGARADCATRITLGATRSVVPALVRGVPGHRRPHGHRRRPGRDPGGRGPRAAGWRRSRHRPAVLSAVPGSCGVPGPITRRGTGASFVGGSRRAGFSLQRDTTGEPGRPAHRVRLRPPRLRGVAGRFADQNVRRFRSPRRDVLRRALRGGRRGAAPAPRALVARRVRRARGRLIRNGACRRPPAGTEARRATSPHQRRRPAEAGRPDG